jgi:SAM-dependent methyltransferase
LNDEDLSEAYTSFYFPSNGKSPKVTFPGTPSTMLRQVFNQLRNLVQPFDGLRMLDYGCGLGDLLVVARDFGLHPVGIEQDPVACREAAARLGKETYRSVYDLLSHDPRARFDLLVLWNVIEHLREPWLDLRQLRTLLRPGGWLLVTTMNVDCLRARLEGRRWENYANPTHFYYFSRQSLNGVIRAAGFSRIEEWKPTLRHPHHGVLRHLFYRLSSYLGVSGGVFYVSTADGDSGQEY